MTTNVLATIILDYDLSWNDYGKHGGDMPCGMGRRLSALPTNTSNSHWRGFY